MNLKVSNSVTTKTYALTNAAPAKPYLNVSNSFLPLTTNTTSGLKLKVTKNNNTYRALEYGTVSSSDTFYTSANVSDGLSSTTGLTRASTSGTTYLTRASTSGTNYGTRASTSNTVYGTRASTSGTKYGTRASTSTTIYQTRASTSGTTYYTRASTSGQQTITEYTSIVSSSILYAFKSIGYLGVTQDVNYIKTQPFDSKNVSYRSMSLTQGVTFNASDIRNNNFSKITFGSKFGHKGMTQYYLTGTTLMTRWNSSYLNYRLAALSPSVSYTIYKSGTSTQPTSYPNVITNKFYPWEPTVFSTLYTLSDYKRYYVTREWGSSKIGVYYPIISYAFSSSGSSTDSKGTYSNTRGISMTELCYYETVAPTTRVSYLTRASTSNTKYGTRASTSNTVYGTRASTSGTTYLTRASTSGTTYYTRVSTSGTTYLTRASTSGTNYGTRASTSGYSGVSSSSNSTTSWI